MGQEVVSGWIILIATVVIAFATVAYTAFTIGIWRATSRNTQATRELLEAAYRPYLGLTVVKFGGLLVHGAADLYATVENAGAVPSRNVEIDFRLTINGRVHREGRAGPPLAMLPKQSVTILCHAFRGEESRFVNPPANMEVAFEIHYQGMTKARYSTQASCTYKSVTDPFLITTGKLT